MHVDVRGAARGDPTVGWREPHEGATITMPLNEEFFGRFGMLTDKFGVQWMLHFNTAPSK